MKHRQTLSAFAAQREIRRRAADLANVSITLHASEQMDKRNIPPSEVFRILREGLVHEAPTLENDE